MTDNLVIYVCATAGQAPEWIQILPLGRVELRDSRAPFEVTADDLRAIIAKFTADGIDLVVDYEHQSLLDGKAPAAGWIKELQTREDGLWARVEWTAEGRRHIEAHEYRYYSPVLRLDPTTRRPLLLMHAALTNTPAMTRLPPLLAAKFGEGKEILILAAASDPKAAQEARSRKYGIGVKEGGHVTKPGQWANVPDEQFADPVNYRYPMPDRDQCRAAWSYWNQADNQAQYSAKERQTIEKRIRSRAREVGMQISAEQEEAKAMKQKLMKLLGISGDQPDEEILALADARLKLAGALPEIARLLELDDKATPGQITGAILALKRGGDRLSQVETELAALKQETAAARARSAVEEALKAGKIQPTQQEWALEYAGRDLAGFKVYVEKAPKIVPVGESLQVLRNENKDAGGLTESELTMCRLTGVSPEAFKASREALAQGQV